MSNTTGLNGRLTEILVVDDSPADLGLTLAAMQDEGDEVRITTLSDGEAAIAYLRREGAYGSAPRPDLIILDLNLPKMSGNEVLTVLKADPRLRQIPTIILSGSADTRDISQAYDRQAAAYIVKPSSSNGYIAAIRAICDLWLGQASLPPHHNQGRMG